MFPPGHIGGALLASALFVRVLGPRQGLWFVAFAVFGGRLPDVDTVLPIPHNGVTHTLVFVVASSVALGVVAGAVVEHYPPAEAAVDALPLSSSEVIVLTAGGLFVGGISHIVLDVLSVGTAVDPKPLHPLWPYRSHRVGLGVIPVRSDVVNVGLMSIGIAVYTVVYVAVHEPPLVRSLLERRTS